MIDTRTSPALNEGLADMPVADAVQAAMRRALESGMASADVIEHGLAAVAAVAIEVDGPRKLAARLLMAADQLAALERPADATSN